MRLDRDIEDTRTPNEGDNSFFAGYKTVYEVWVTTPFGVKFHDETFDTRKDAEDYISGIEYPDGSEEIREVEIENWQEKYFGWDWPE